MVRTSLGLASATSSLKWTERLKVDFNSCIQKCCYFITLYLTPNAHQGLAILASDTSLYIAKIPIEVIKKYSDINQGHPLPHKLFNKKFVDAQLDIARNIQETFKIPQLQGDVDLCVQPLTDESQVKTFLEEPDQADAAHSDKKTKIGKTAPKTIPGS